MVRPFIVSVVSLLLLLATNNNVVSAFTLPIQIGSNNVKKQWNVCQAQSDSTTAATSTTTTTKTTLDEATTWRLRFFFQNLPTAKGKTKTNIRFNIDVTFNEDVGYEPPQGSLIQVNNNKNDGPVINKLSSMNLVKSRWQLSEDPNDRKDGLWVWGLFQEPLYPFLLLQMETDAIPLPPVNDNQQEEEEEDYILPLKLYCQLGHRRDAQQGVLLENTVPLKIRVMETVKADMFGAADVDIYDEVSVGQLSIAATNVAQQ